MPKMSGAQFMADALHAYGVTHIFFVPTILSHSLAQMDERGTNIARVLTHGEKAAAYMADGYARASGRPGVCMAQIVGGVNLAAGLRDAHLACTPLIAFTGGTTPQIRYRNAYQETEDISAFDPVTKFNATVESVERFPDLLRQAFRVATSGTPGPVHLRFSGNLGQVEQEVADLELIVEENFKQVPAFRPEPEPESITHALEVIGGAKRPIIVAGGGVRTSGANAELVAFAEKLQIPVATSMNGKETIPGDHPLSVGVVGSYSRRSANELVSEADLVFFIGTQTGGMTTHFWRVPKIGTPAVQLDIDPEELGRNYPLKASIMGDAKISLEKLIEAAGPAPDRGEWLARVNEMGAAWRAEFAPFLNSDDSPMRPERICKTLSEQLPSDAIVLADTGHSGMWTGGYLDLKSPGHQLHTRGGPPGLGIPGGIGGQVRRARAARHPLHRRRGFLVSHRGNRDRRALGHQRRHPREQQRLPEPGDQDFQRRLRRRAARKGARTLALQPHEFLRDRKVHGRREHSRGKTGRTRLRDRQGLQHEQRPRYSGRRHGHRGLAPGAYGPPD